MSSGDLDRSVAARLQRFTGREDCGARWNGEGTVPCHPPCETCLALWLDTLEVNDA